MSSIHYGLVLGLAATMLMAQCPVVGESDESLATEQAVWRPVSPLEAVDTIEIHPLFQLDLVASEPLIHQPSAVAFDEFGRLFVAEAPAILTESASPQGMIKLLEDTDGDGIFDTASVFAEKLAQPRGLACWNSGVFVLDAGAILLITDTSGDGRADRIERVFTGFDSGAGTIESIPLCWRIDNRIYGHFGGLTGRVKRADAPNNPPVDLGGTGFVFDPCGRTIDGTIGHGPRGLVYDAWGREYVAAEDNPIQAVVAAGLQQGQEVADIAAAHYVEIAEEGVNIPIFQASPGRAVETNDPLDPGRGLNPSGLTIYEGDAWPPAFQGSLLILDARDNLIHRRVLVDNGLLSRSRRAEAETEFLRSSDSGFRPVQAIGGPDGNLYVLDRYGENYDAPAETKVAEGRSSEYGRIYRISPKGFGGEKRLLPGEASAEERVGMLAHPNRWHRETAARLICAAHSKALAPALELLARTSPVADARVRALYALAGLDALNNKVLADALSGEDALVRMHAALLARPRLVTEAGNLDTIIALADDPDPRVRLEATRQLGAVWLERRIPPLVRVCRQNGADQWFRKAILDSTGVAAPAVLRELMQDHDYCIAPENAPLLHELAGISVRSPELEALDSALDLLDSLPEDAGAACKVIASGFAAGAVDAGRWGFLKDLVNSSDARSAVMLDLVNEARTCAVDPNLSAAERIHAIGLLSADKFENAGALLAGLMIPAESVHVQSAAVQSLGLLQTRGVVSLLVGAWPHLGPEVRGKVIALIYSSGDYIEDLLDEVESGAINLETLMHCGFLDLTLHPNVLIRQRVATILATTQREPVADTSLVYRRLHEIKSSPENGALVFKDNCLACHRINGFGNLVGPDLDFMAQAGPFKLLENVLNPNAVVVPEFFSYTVETNDFESFAGIIVKEDASSILVRGPNGEEHTVPRDSIESMTCSDKTLMPIGWDEALGEQNLADLIAYLVEAVTPAKPEA